MEAMCATLGVPVEAGSAAHGAMAARCARCEKGADCLLWRMDGAEGREAAPGYCLNAEAIEVLARTR